jgi:hypothetical protein
MPPMLQVLDASRTFICDLASAHGSLMALALPFSLGTLLALQLQHARWVRSLGVVLMAWLSWVLLIGLSRVLLTALPRAYRATARLLARSFAELGAVYERHPQLSLLFLAVLLTSGFFYVQWLTRGERPKAFEPS